MLRATLVFALAVLSATASAEAPWWQKAVFYEIYPRSFADSDGDGVGDLKGITGKLDYLKALGVDALWITPFFPSPQVDFGYDVSDFCDIDRMYGTLADFDELVREAKRRDLRIILDLVVNHTSDQHPWFVDSRTSKSAAHRDWYVWRDGRDGGPPSNWLSIFGESAWRLDAKTGQYYYHYFYPQQPDLNWRNPAVERAILDVTRFWYRRGVSGFRLDAVDTLFEVPQVTDNPVLAGTDAFGRPRMDEKYDKKLPEVHEVMKKLRAVADEHGAVLIGETWTSDVEELRSYYGARHDELQLPMDLMMTQLRPLSAARFRQHVASVDGAGEWPTYVMSNHDVQRAYSRFADGAHDAQIAKLVAALQLTLRGTAILYYGEEIGMQNRDPVRKEEVRDPIGKLGWPREKGRDGERTPMQWSGDAQAGFTTGTPWLPVSRSYGTRNVAAEEADPDSILRFYRQLLELRHKRPALRDGDYLAVHADDKDLLCYLRRTADDVVLVVLNMTARPRRLRLRLPGALAGAAHKPLLVAAARQRAATVELGAYGVYVASLQGQAR